MRPSLAAAVAALLFTTSCGYIAGTLAPLANVPAAPQDLAATQRGSEVIAHFTVPSLTTEMIPIKGALELDLRAGPPPTPWNEADWAAHAQRLTTAKLIKIAPPNKKVSAGFVAEYQFPSTAWNGKDIVIAARVKSENGKDSNWTPFLTLPIVPPLTAPADLKAAGTPTGIELTWRAPAGHFRILRRTEGDPAFTELAVTTAPEYLDKTAEFGKTYTYQVLAFAEAAPHQEAQSDLSNEASWLYKDTFPPATPSGLRAATSAASIELSWEANTEPDLAGYRVYRSTNGGVFEKIADVNEIPAYSDRAVEHGKTYRYAITSIDKSNNESSRSPEVEASLQ